MAKLEFVYESDVKANAQTESTAGVTTSVGCLTEEDVARMLPKPISRTDKAPSGPSSGKAEPNGPAPQNKPADSPTKATATQKGVR